MRRFSQPPSEEEVKLREKFHDGIETLIAAYVSSKTEHDEEWFWARARRAPENIRAIISKIGLPTVEAILVAINCKPPMNPLSGEELGILFSTIGDSPQEKALSHLRRVLEKLPKVPVEKRKDLLEEVKIIIEKLQKTTQTLPNFIVDYHLSRLAFFAGEAPYGKMHASQYVEREDEFDIDLYKMETPNPSFKSIFALVKKVDAQIEAHTPTCCLSFWGPSKAEKAIQALLRALGAALLTLNRKYLDDFDRDKLSVAFKSSREVETLYGEVKKFFETLESQSTPVSDAALFTRRKSLPVARVKSDAFPSDDTREQQSTPKNASILFRRRNSLPASDKNDEHHVTFVDITDSDDDFEIDLNI